MATRAIPIRTGSLRDAAHDIAECFSEHSLLTYASAIAFRAIVALVVIVKVDWPSTIDRLRAWWAARRGRPKPPPIRDSLMPDPPS